MSTLKGKVTKERLVLIRGDSKIIQLQYTKRMIQVSQGLLDLVDRGVGGSPQKNLKKLDASNQQPAKKAVHFYEVE